MNKRFLLMGAAAVLVMATVVGSALGAGQASSEKPVVADLEAAAFSIEWSDRQETSETVPVTVDASGVMPGDTIELKDSQGNPGIYNVDNTGTADAYIRVTVKAYWADLNGQRLEDLDPAAIGLAANNEDWISTGETSTDDGAVFYYKEPVAPGQSTRSCCKPFLSARIWITAIPTSRLCWKRWAEGVQFAGSQYNELNANGIAYEWGVEAVLNEDGSIASIQQ